MSTLTSLLVRHRLHKTAEESGWRCVPDEIGRYVKMSADVVAGLKKALKEVPEAMPGYHHVYWHPDRKEVYFGLGDSDEMPSYVKWEKKFASVPGVKVVTMGDAETPPRGWKDKSEPWMLVKKSSEGGHGIAQALNWMPGPTNNFFGGPSPLAATLAGGLLGGGLGYGAGWLGEKVLGEKVVNKGRLRKVLAALGAAGGAAPALWWGSIAQREHPDMPGAKAWLSSWPAREEDLQEDSMANLPEGIKEAIARVHKQFPDCKPSAPFIKAAEVLGGGAFSLDAMPAIPKNNFGQVVWQDENTPMAIRSATTGLLESASQVRNTSWISPADVARIGVGMGTGYLSGLVVGKTLGALAGLTPDAQQALQRAGTWAGILTNTVPMIFGR